MDRIRRSLDGSTVEDLIGIAKFGVYAAINHFATLGPGGQIPRVGYPQLEVVFPRLRVTLHTDSLALAQNEDVQARDWLVAMGKHVHRRETKPPLDLLLTPARSREGEDWSSVLDLATFALENIPGSLRNLYGLSLNANWELMRHPDEPQAPTIDIRVHRMLERDLFVTLDERLLSLSLMVRPEGNPFVLTPREAQRYIDLCLKAFAKYYIKTNHITNRSLYYWTRLWNLVPAFQQAWPYVVYGKVDLPDGTPIMEFMEALYARLIGQMQACDRIGRLRYGIPTSDARDEMLNQLNYFFMLATGVFDSLAWIACHRFGLRTGRLNVTLREERPVGRANPFFALLDAAAPALASFLRGSQQQAKIALFYAPRDTVQHRLVLTGAHFNSGQVISDCNVAFLSREDARAIQTIDSQIPENRPFSEWGLMTIPEFPDQVLLEPYCFTRSALKFLFSFVNDVLHLLDFSEWMEGQPDVKAAADNAIIIARSENNIHFDVPYP